jgi:hypothetical protein
VAVHSLLCTVCRRKVSRCKVRRCPEHIAPRSCSRGDEGETGAAEEGIFADGEDASGDGDGGHAGAARERADVDADNRVAAQLIRDDQFADIASVAGDGRLPILQSVVKRESPT